MDLNPVNLARRMAAAVLSRPSNPQTGSRLMYIGPNNAQVKVTPEIALMVSAVWACIDVVSSALSSSDWNVYAGFRAEDKQTFTPRDPLQYLLNTRPNEEMTAQSAKRAMLIAANSWGNGYAEIGRDMAGRVAALWPLAPDRVTLMRDGDGRLFYRVFNDGYETSWVDLDPRDVFHIRGPGMSGLLGDNPIAKAVQTIAMSVALDQFGAAYFANNTQMGGVLETGGKLDDPTFARVRDQFNTKNKGSRRAFGATPILEGGLKYTQLGTDADKAQLIEAKYQQVEEVCRWFRVPPHKIAHLLRATNNNIEHQGLEFSRDTLRPWKKEIEQEADFKLFPARGAARFLDIDIDWASEGDYKSRMEALQIGRGMGVFSANDVLRKLGENTIGPEGDIRIVNGAAIPLEKVGENYSAAAAPASAPATGTSLEQEENAE